MVLRVGKKSMAELLKQNSVCVFRVSCVVYVCVFS